MCLILFLSSLSYLSEEVRLVEGREDCAFAGTESDFVASTVSHTFEQHGVTILEEGAHLFVGKRNGFLTTPAELHD